MTNDRFLPFAFPAVASKKITAAFDGGRITSDGGVMVLAQAERRLASRHYHQSRRTVKAGAVAAPLEPSWKPHDAPQKSDPTTR
jgi:hypothetical protein